MSGELDSSQMSLLVGMSYHDISYIVGSQVDAANYLLPPVRVSANTERLFRDNRALWAALLAEEVRVSSTLILEGFFLFEWLPRSPGLFYTHQAELNRKYARSRLLSKMEDRPAGVPAAELPYIFDRKGKAAMLRGGIGCIRLKPLPGQHGIATAQRLGPQPARNTKSEERATFPGGEACSRSEPCAC